MDHRRLGTRTRARPPRVRIVVGARRGGTSSESLLRNDHGTSRPASMRWSSREESRVGRSTGWSVTRSRAVRWLQSTASVGSTPVGAEATICTSASQPRLRRNTPVAAAKPVRSTSRRGSELQQARRRPCLPCVSRHGSRFLSLLRATHAVTAGWDPRSAAGSRPMFPPPVKPTVPAHTTISGLRIDAATMRANAPF